MSSQVSWNAPQRGSRSGEESTLYENRVPSIKESSRLQCQLIYHGPITRGISFLGLLLTYSITYRFRKSLFHIEAARTMTVFGLPNHWQPLT